MTEAVAAATDKKVPPEDNMLLHVPGVTGSYKGAGYEGWLRIDSFQFGAGCAVGRGGRRRRRAAEASSAMIEEVSIGMNKGF